MEQKHKKATHETKKPKILSKGIKEATQRNSKAIYEIKNENNIPIKSKKSVKLKQPKIFKMAKENLTTKPTVLYQKIGSLTPYFSSSEYGAEILSEWMAKT